MEVYIKDLTDIYRDIEEDSYPVELLNRNDDVVGYFITPERMKLIDSACKSAALWEFTHTSLPEGQPDARIL